MSVFLTSGRVFSGMTSALRVLSVLTLAGFSAGGASNAELSQVQFVYLLPMGSSFDQYLANRLTSEQVFQVVTDPQKADAVLTDQLGKGFEQRLEELYPPPPPPPPPVEEAKTEDEEKTLEAAKAEAAAAEEAAMRPMMSTFGRGRGNVFLVDLKSRRVLWSIYDRPKNSTPDNLDRTAARVVSRLKKDLTGK